MRIREEVGKYIQRLQQLAQAAIATVDVLQSLASVAESQQLNRPSFMKNDESRSTKVAIRLLRK